jgi:hypothetical protein
MPTTQSDWIIPLASAGVGAVIGALITVLTEWALTSIRDASTNKRERKIHLRQWWRDLKTAVHRFDLKWTPWANGDHPNFDDPKPWLADLFEELLRLRSTLGPCEVRSNIDHATEEISRVSQLEMQWQGQAAEAYDDFVKTTNNTLSALKQLADTISD